VSIRTEMHNGPVLGHDKFSYKRQKEHPNEKGEYLWVRLGDKFTENLSRNVSAAGLPLCLSRVFEFA
jgi:hypothetical protein